eukprot:Nk52_evm7s165 gene=Nk52_evmTU7s165
MLQGGGGGGGGGGRGGRGGGSSPGTGGVSVGGRSVEEQESDIVKKLAKEFQQSMHGERGKEGNNKGQLVNGGPSLADIDADVIRRLQARPEFMMPERNSSNNGARMEESGSGNHNINSKSYNVELLVRSRPGVCHLFLAKYNAHKGNKSSLSGVGKSEKSESHKDWNVEEVDEEAGEEYLTAQMGSSGVQEEDKAMSNGRSGVDMYEDEGVMVVCKVLLVSEQHDWPFQWGMARSEYTYMQQLNGEESRLCPHVYELFSIGMEYAVIVMEYLNGSETIGDMMHRSQVQLPCKVKTTSSDASTDDKKATHPASSAQRRTMPLDLFLCTAKKLLMSLGRIHGYGIVHRDIKLSNILIKQSNALSSSSVRVIDFSVSGEHNSIFHDCTGTLNYIAPECFRRSGGFLNYCIDIYSLGVVFYEMLTGQLPYAAASSPKDPAEIIRMHLSVIPKRIDDINPEANYPKWLGDIVERMLVKNPRDRYQSCHRIYHDIIQLEKCSPSLGLAICSDGTNPSHESLRQNLGKGNALLHGLDDVVSHFKLQQEMGISPCISVSGDMSPCNSTPLASTSVELHPTSQPIWEVEKARFNEPSIPYGSREYWNTLEINFSDVFGNQEQVKSLLKIQKATAHSDSRMVTISGLSGSGKSTLYQSFRRELDESIVIGEGKCDQNNRTIPFLLWSQALGSLIDGIQSKSPATLDLVLKRLKENKYISWSIMNEFAPTVDNLLQMEIYDTQCLDMNSKRRKNLDSFEHFLRCIGAEFQMVLFLDDTMWIDNDSLDVLKHLVGLKDIPLLIICSYRSNEMFADHPFMSAVKVYEEKVEKAAATKHATGAESVIYDEEGTDLGLVHFECKPLLLTEVKSIIHEKCGIPFGQTLDKLAEYIESRTNNIVYEVLNLLRFLERDRVLWYDCYAGKWTFRPKDGMLTESGSNIEVLQQTFKRFSSSVQRFLKIGAVLGPEFKVDFVFSAMKDLSMEEKQDVEIESIIRDLGMVIGERILAVKNEASTASRLIMSTSVDETRDARKGNMSFAADENFHELRFYHDQVQEAVLASMDQDEKDKYLRLVANRFGTMYNLMDVLKETKKQKAGINVDIEVFFRMAGYLNAISDKLSLEEDSQALLNCVYCNCISCEYALNVICSYEAAGSFARKGCEIVQRIYGSECFERDRDTCLRLHRVKMICCGTEDETGEEFFKCKQLLLSKFKGDPVACGEIYFDCLNIFEYKSLYTQVIREAFNVFFLFPNLYLLAPDCDGERSELLDEGEGGEEFRKKMMPTWEDSTNVIEEYTALMKEKEVTLDNIINLPNANSKAMDLIGTVASKTIPSAYLSSNYELYNYLPALFTYLTLKHGLCSASSACLSVHGFCLATFFNKEQFGHDLSNISVTISTERFSQDNLQKCVAAHHAGMSGIYASPMPIVKDNFDKAIECAIASGETNYRTYAWCFWTWASAVHGLNVLELCEYSEEKTVLFGSVSILPFFVQIQGLCALHQYMHGGLKSYRNDAFNLCLQMGIPLLVGALRTFEMANLIHLDEVDLSVVEEVDALCNDLKGMISWFEYAFYRPYVDLLLYEKATRDSKSCAGEIEKLKKSAIKELESKLEIFEKWSSLTPMFERMCDAQKAELLRLEGDSATAKMLYEKCVSSARTHGSLKMGGFVARRFGDLLTLEKMPTLAMGAYLVSYEMYSEASAFRVVRTVPIYSEQGHIRALGAHRRTSEHPDIDGGALRIRSCDATTTSAADMMSGTIDSNPVTNTYATTSNPSTQQHSRAGTGTLSMKHRGKPLRENVMEQYDMKAMMEAVRVISLSNNLSDIKLESTKLAMTYSGAQKAALFLMTGGMKGTTGGVEGSGNSDSRKVPVLHAFATAVNEKEKAICDVEILKAEGYQQRLCVSMVHYVARTKHMATYASPSVRSDNLTSQVPQPTGSVSAHSTGTLVASSKTIDGQSGNSATSAAQNAAIKDFSNDPFICATNPVAIRCLPLLSRNELVGILYTEVGKGGMMFDEHAYDFVVNLGSQIAVSVQSAVLCEELEAKVGLRAQALKEKEKSASEMAFLLSAVIQHMRDGMIAINADNQIVVINKEFANLIQLPKRSSTYVGMDFCKVMNSHIISEKKSSNSANGLGVLAGEEASVSEDHEEYKTATRAQFYQLLQSVAENDSYLIDPFDVFVDGKMYLSVVPVRLESGIRIIALNDRTDKFLENELRQKVAIQARNDFLAFMCHELRNPLNGTLGLCEIILETQLTPTQEGYIQQMRGCSDLMATIVNDVLDFSKLEAGALEIDEDVLDIRLLAEQCTKLQTIAIVSSSNLRLLTDVSPEVPQFILGDRTRLQQILINLTSNAIKYTPQGTVTVRASVVKGDRGSTQKSQTPGTADVTPNSSTSLGSHGWLLFEVVDTGVGIAEESCRKLFTRYYQVRTQYGKNVSGTGLGLRICKLLVERMGGSVGVHSVVGEGTTFWFKLPLKLAKEGQTDVNKATGDSERVADDGDGAKNERQIRREEEAAAASKVTPETFSGLRALLVDDDKLCRLVASKFLTKAGLRVDTAENGQVGIDIVKEKGQGYYDIVYMDMCMPVMSGLDAIAIIRDKNQLGFSCEDVPICALTANAVQEEKERAFKAGATGFVTKPCTYERILVSLTENIHKK